MLVNINPDDQQLLPIDQEISLEWPEPPPPKRLHVVVILLRGIDQNISSVWVFSSSGTGLVILFPCPAESDVLYNTANALHQAM